MTGKKEETKWVWSEKREGRRCQDVQKEDWTCSPAVLETTGVSQFEQTRPGAAAGPGTAQQQQRQGRAINSYLGR